MKLTPNGNQNMFGRTDFRIHGNNATNDASTGCIVMPKPVHRSTLGVRGGTLTVTK
jgi:hypothetical protein